MDGWDNIISGNICLTTVSYNWSTISFRAVFNCLSKNKKTKISLWPILKKTDNPTNQSKFKVITCSGLEARENVCQRVTVGLGFTSDWDKKSGASFLNMSSCSLELPNQTTEYYIRYSSENRSRNYQNQSQLTYASFSKQFLAFNDCRKLICVEFPSG